LLDSSRGPLDREPVDRLGITESEMNLRRHLRTVRVMRVELADDPTVADIRLEPRADAQPIAGVAAERDGQVMLLRELVLVQEERAAANLPHHEVKLAVVPEVGGDDRSAIAVIVGAGQIANIKKIAALLVDEDAFPLIGTEIVPARHDIPGIIDPELAKLRIEGAGGSDLRTAV